MCSRGRGAPVSSTGLDSRAAICSRNHLVAAAIAFRDRCQPYVEVIEGQLAVHSPQNHSRASKQVNMRLLRRVRRGWNKTILVLKDGTRCDRPRFIHDILRSPTV